MLLCVSTLCGSCGDDAASDGDGGRSDDEIAALEEQVDDLRAQLDDITASTIDVLDEAAESTTTEAPTTTSRRTTTTSPPQPSGSLEVQGVAFGYGQGTASGPCANWELGFANRSDTEISEILFAPPGGEYSNLVDYDVQTQTYPPPIAAIVPTPATLTVSLRPGVTQVLTFQTCTATPPPANTNYEFGALAPSRVEFTWSTGHRGSTCFGISCG